MVSSAAYTYDDASERTSETDAIMASTAHLLLVNLVSKYAAPTPVDTPKREDNGELRTAP